MTDDETAPAAPGVPPDRPDPPGATLPRLGPIGWLRWIWRRLTSMRTALLLLLLLAVGAIPGSVFPQTSIDPSRVDAYRDQHTVLAPWLDRVGGFAVYSSPWFSSIYLLLFVSLVGCVLPRSKQHWKASRAQPPRAPRRLDRMAAHRSETVDVPVDQVLEAARHHLRGRRYRVVSHDGSTVSAERGFLGETGNLAFHLALLGLLVAVAAGSFFGYNGQTIVVKGESWSNTVLQYDSFQAGRAVDPSGLAPYSLRLDDLSVTFDDTSRGNQFGAPRDFEARVTYQERPGAPREQRIVKVNRPLDVDGARVFLVGNGYAPHITVRDHDGDVAWSKAMPFLASDAEYTSNGVVKVPDARPQQIGLIGFLLPTAAIAKSTGQPVSVFPDLRNPRFLFNAWVGDLGVDNGVPQSVNGIDLDKMKQLKVGGKPFSAMLAPGQSVDLPDGNGSVTLDYVLRYAALNVRSDPAKIWVLLFAVVALAGLTLSLSVRRRRVWVRAVADGPCRTVVEVAGLVRQENVDLSAETATVLSAALRRARHE